MTKEPKEVTKHPHRPHTIQVTSAKLRSLFKYNPVIIYSALIEIC